MKRIFAAILVFAAMCAVPAFADTADPEDTAAGETITPIIQVDSSEALEETLAAEPGANGAVIVQLNEGTIIDGSVFIPENVTLDLNGQTINGGVSLDGNGASVINGTINGGNITVRTDDPDGRISNMTINDAPEKAAILIRGGTIGDITDNTITGADYHAIRLENEGAAGDITGNTLTNCRGDGISVYFGSHCGVISYNRLTNIGGHDNTSNGDFAITINGSASAVSYAKEITHNEIDGITYAGIVVFGGGQTNTDADCGGYLTGDIAYNTVKNAATYTKNKECEAAIYVDRHALVKGDIHDNIVEASRDDGISVISYSTLNGSIYNNTVTGSKHAGIGVKNNSVVKKNISNNTITSPKEAGIFINGKAKVKGSILQNTISRAGTNGISVMNSARANIIKKNKVTKAGMYAVIAASKGKIDQVVSNTLSVNNAKAGLVILSNSKCLISKIKSNKISGKFNAGIRVKSPTGKVTIKSNTIKSSSPKKKRSVGISCEKAKKGLTISGNKITGNKSAPGIYLSKCKASVKSNKIKKCSTKISRN